MATTKKLIIWGVVLAGLNSAAIGLLVYAAYEFAKFQGWLR